MAEEGWAVSPLSSAVPGTYCLGCAAALRLLDWSLACVDCGATVVSEQAAEERGWRFFPDELGQLQPHCGLCSAEPR
jgi:hypothetical protein